MSVSLSSLESKAGALGLAQFVTTFLITWLYVRHANRNLDPLAGQLRDELEGGSHAHG